MAIVSFAISAASQAMAIKAQDAQFKAQVDAHNQSIQAAGKALSDQMGQENVRLQQEQASAVEKKLDLRRESLRAKGTTLASSESGGMSEELLLRDIERQQASYSDQVTQTIKNQMQQSYWNKQGMASDAASRANANAPVSSGASSSLGLGLGLLGAGMSAYNDFHIKSVKGDITSRNSATSKSASSQEYNKIRRGAV